MIVQIVQGPMLVQAEQEARTEMEQAGLKTHRWVSLLGNHQGRALDHHSRAKEHHGGIDEAAKVEDLQSVAEDNVQAGDLT
ncbi:hypothetical protein Q8A67_022985 [Cirrhinus molitorella]|uniref:Uncharacterized protein n=1 Tax=Cirrhinus molitorella TaxID=172907 RepID=A0AA88P7R1_9TELE|nr:hypothetical protein Q8A67_022985 [Cirrhinus molitorella]